MVNPILFIKRALLGYKKPKYKLIQMSWSIIQKLDSTIAKKNPDGSTSIELTIPHPSFNEAKLSKQQFDENQVLDWLINKGHFQMVIRELFMDRSLPILSARELDTPYVDPKKIPGDLDLVLFQNPDLAIALECKVIKYDNKKSLAHVDEPIRAFNKLRGIDKGWLQLDGYRRLGFHKTYLLLIVLDDQSYNEAVGQLSRKVKNEIVTNLKSLNTEEQSGILIYYVSQITKFDFNVQNIVRLDHFKEAIPLVQTESLTNLIVGRLKDFNELRH